VGIDVESAAVVAVGEMAQAEIAVSLVADGK
jgi:hypothetical protein